MSNIKRKRWTTEEESILIAQVDKYQNLQNALEETAKLTGRSFGAVREKRLKLVADSKLIRVYHHFSKEDDSIIITEIKKNPQNLSYAFKQASNKIGTTESSVRDRYYKKLRKNTKFTIFTVVSNTKHTTNVKNGKPNVVKKHKTGIWRTILNWFK